MVPVLYIFSTLLTQLSGQSEDTIDQLVARLAAGDDVRTELVQRGEIAIPSLARLVKDADVRPDVRQTALLALGDIGGESVVAPLRQALSDPRVLWAAVHALGRVGSHARSAVPDLAKIATTTGEPAVDFVARRAAEAIGSIGHGSKEAIDALVLRMGRDHRRDDRHQAALALTKLGQPGADALIYLALKYSTDDRPHQERNYGEAYAVLTGATSLPKEMIPVLKQHVEQNTDAALIAALALAAVGPPAKPVLFDLLDHRESDVRANAALSLSTMNFNAFAARTYRGEQIADPVAPDEVFPKLEKLYRRDDGRIDWRIIEAMIGIDRERALANSDIRQILEAAIIEQLRQLD